MKIFYSPECLAYSMPGHPESPARAQFTYEYLEEKGIERGDVNNPAYKDWVRKRVDSARVLFEDGKEYLDELDVLRCKIVGYWYCARFEVVLDTIEKDGYRLREEYLRLSRDCIRNCREAIEAAKASCAIVLMYVRPQVLLERIMANGLPAFFDPADPEGSFRRLFRQRMPRYRSLAEIEVDNSDLPPEETARDLIDVLRT